MIDYKRIKTEDEFIRAVAEDCINNMSDEDKEYIRKNPVSGEYHFGYALYIRNHYIHGKKLQFMHFDADTMSSNIMKCIFSILLPDEYDINDDFIKGLFDMHDFVQVRNEYKRQYGLSPIDVVCKYRDEYTEAIKPLKIEEEKLKEEADAIFEEHKDELIQEALIEIEDDPSYRKAPKKRRIIAAEIRAHLRVWHDTVEKNHDKQHELFWSIRKRLTEDIAESVWHTDIILDKANKYGVPLETIEPLINELKNILFEHFEFVPLEVTFLKLKDYVGEDEYDNAKTLLIRTLNENWRLAREMDPSWFDDRRIAKEVLKDGCWLNLLTQYQDDEEMVRYALERNGDQITAVSERLRNDRDIIKLAVSHCSRIAIMQNDCMEPYRSDKELVYLACKTNRRNLMFVDPVFQDDYELMKQIVPLNQLESAYWGMSERLRDDLSLALLDVETERPCVKQYSERLKDSKRIAKRLIQVHGKNCEHLQYMSKRIQRIYHYQNN